MAWTVVLMHLVDFSGCAARPSLGWLKVIFNGDAAVNVFITLSGFVITHLLLVRGESYRPYITRRALRILPIYYVCLLLSLAVLPAMVELHTQPWVADHAPWARRFFLFSHAPWKYVALHLTLLHGVVPDNWLLGSSWMILGPAWSLSLEWQFYLVAPFLLLSLRINRAAEIGVVAALLAIRFLLEQQTVARWEWPSFLPLSIHFFLLGILCRYHLKALSGWPRWLIPVIGLGAVLAFPAWRYELIVWTVFLSVVLLEERPIEASRGNLSTATQRLVRAIANPTAIFFGRCSYSTYLVHIPFLASITWITAHGLGFTSQAAETIAMLVSLPLLALLSFGLYRAIEAPFIRLGAQAKASKSVAVAESPQTRVY
jgi:peptidoglycan/LPS O-acetylase OafA/YrhL